MKKTSLLLVVCLVFSVLAVSCNKTKANNASGKITVKACIASEPETIDPNLASSVDASSYAHHLFENLMKYEMTDSHPANDPNVYMTKIVPGQAESYTVSSDEKIYTFKLRNDIYWSDGKSVTAYDFEYSWKRLVDPATAADYGYFLDGIVLNASDIQKGLKDKETLGIKALDDKTLQITLEAPCSYFMEICVFAALMPLRQDVVEGNANWTEPGVMVSNGPFKLGEWVHDSYIKFIPNEHYYNAANVGPEAIVYTLSDSETTILAAYQSGNLNFMDNTFPTDMIETLQKSGDCFINPYVGTYYLYLNCAKIPDWRVRAAMVLSVDRDNIVKNVTMGGQNPATGLVASGILDSKGNDFAYGSSELGALYSNLQKKYPSYDLSTYAGKCELAKKLYNDAVADGTWNPNTTIVYNFNTSESHRKIAEACGTDWKTVLGMNITLQNQEWSTYTNGLGEHTFGVARLGWIADYNDAMTYLELMVTDNSYNYGLYSDYSYDYTISQAKSASSKEDRDYYLYSAEQILFGEGGFPVCPIYYYTQPYCMKNLKNVGYTPMGYYFFSYATN